MVYHRQKPLDQLQGKGSKYRTQGLRVVTPDESQPIPSAPADTQPNARKRWRMFWTSAMSTAIDLKSDTEAIYRWLHCMSERERLQPLADKSPLVKGSTGQLVSNPLYAIIAQYSKEIARFEDHFGMTPIARFRLGITAVEHERGVRDLRHDLDQARTAPTAPLVIDLEDIR